MAFSFGTPAAASTPGFGFGQAASTPAFGATLNKTSSTPLFGAATTAGAAPGLFGPTTTPSFSFTPAAPAAGFGQQQQPAAAAQPSLFGAASTPSLFGAASTPAAAPSLFGAAAPSSAPSLFGGASTPATGTGFSFGGGFGAPAGTAQPTGLFGSQQQGQGALGGFGAGPPQAPDLSAIRELESIKDSYVPSPANVRFRFQYLFLNVVENPAARVKPPNVDELQWREALQRAGGPDNPEHLWPVLAQGFTDLLARKSAQDAAMQEHQARLEGLSQLAAQLSARQETVIREQLAAVRRRHMQLAQKLLHLVRQIDALEARFGQAMGFRGPGREVMQQLAAQLGALEEELGPVPSGGVQGKVNALAAAARLRAGAPSPAFGGAEAGLAVDKASLESVFSVLSQYSEALGKLQEVARRDGRDLAVLERATKEDSSY